MKCTVQHKFLPPALFLTATYLFLLNLLSLSLSSPSLPHGPALDSHTSRDPEVVCLLVRNRRGITSLKGFFRVLRLRTAGEEMYRLILFSASCCGPPPLLSFYHVFPLSVILPCSIYHTLSECLGHRPQKQQGAFCYRPDHASLAFATTGNQE